MIGKQLSLSFRDGAQRRTRNPDTGRNADYVSGFRVGAFSAPWNDERELAS
jgi:hypothetical protein